MPDLLDDLARSVGPTLVPMQGSYSSTVAASASTHSGGGAIDVSIKGWPDADVWNLLAESRKRGLVMSKRTPAQGFVLHAHGIVDSCPHLSGLARPVVGTAAWQVQEYHAGRNGLAGQGKDDGPRDYVGATWWTYRKDNPTKPPVPAYPREGDDMIVCGTVAENDNSPDGISGKILLCLPGFPEPLWLNGDQWGYITRVFPYWAPLPGSPFYWSQVRDMNLMIQPSMRQGLTADEVQERIVNVMRSEEFHQILQAFGGGDGKAEVDPGAIEAAIRQALARIFGLGAASAVADQVRALDKPGAKMATIAMVPRLRGDAGKEPGESVVDLDHLGLD